jgi:hypothetical protein
MKISMPISKAMFQIPTSEHDPIMNFKDLQGTEVAKTHLCISEATVAAAEIIRF